MAKISSIHPAPSILPSNMWLLTLTFDWFSRLMCSLFREEFVKMHRPQLCPAFPSWAGLSSVICLISHDLSLLPIPISLSLSGSEMCGYRAVSITISTYRWASASLVMLVQLNFFLSEVRVISASRLDTERKTRSVSPQRDTEVFPSLLLLHAAITLHDWQHQTLTSATLRLWTLCQFLKN